MIKLLIEGGVAPDFDSAEERVTNRVNEICKNILDNTSVFKKDHDGFSAFVKFMNVVGCTINEK